MRIAVLCALLLSSVVCATARTDERQDQQGFLVFEGERCITVSAGPHTRLEFPMVNGEPEMKSARLVKAIAGVVTAVDKDGRKVPVCPGFIEARKIEIKPETQTVH